MRIIKGIFYIILVTLCVTELVLANDSENRATVEVRNSE